MSQSDNRSDNRCLTSATITLALSIGLTPRALDRVFVVAPCLLPWETWHILLTKDLQLNRNAFAPEFTPHSHCCPDMTRRFPRQRTSFLKALTLWPRKVSPAPSTPTNRCNSDLRCGHAHARAPCPWRGAVCALHCLVPTCSHTTHHVSTPTSDTGDIACLSVMYSSSFLSDDSQRATTLAFAHPLRVFRQVARRWRASCTARIQVNQRGWHPSREHRCGITRAHRPT